MENLNFGGLVSIEEYKIGSCGLKIGLPLSQTSFFESRVPNLFSIVVLIFTSSVHPMSCHLYRVTFQLVPKVAFYYEGLLQNATFVSMSTGGWDLPEWSPCR